MPTKKFRYYKDSQRHVINVRPSAYNRAKAMSLRYRVPLIKIATDALMQYEINEDTGR